MYFSADVAYNSDINGHKNKILFKIIIYINKCLYQNLNLFLKILNVVQSCGSKVFVVGMPY